ncbi:acyltransferase [Flavobacterium sp.]|uniref:acyltransferase n=1 Tax=Flavobacterium sp. TaxID=239 RepID=UPI0028BE8E68|nr:acyltransferase [Flavobacterium sp.]
MIAKIRYVFFKIQNALRVALYKNKGITLSYTTLFYRKPIIVKVKGASIQIGEHTLINSDNSNYHINMHSPCKLMADREGASIIIGNHSRIHGTCIHAYKSITIGDNCLIAANTQIMDGNGHALSFPEVENRIRTTDYGIPIVIEDNVWIGANCIILGGTRIGKGTVISAGSVVKGDIPPMSIYGGNPAKLIKSYQ